MSNKAKVLTEQRLHHGVITYFEHYRVNRLDKAQWLR